jgi:hypothetical protein
MVMNITSFATVDALALSALFGVSAVLHFTGPWFIREAYARWGFPGRFYRISGAIQLLAALFLTNPITRLWGVALAAFITFVAVVLLLSAGRYRTSVPGMLVLVALIPAILAGPLA